MAEAEAQVSLEPEEQARAFWYGLISRLFYAPPDRLLLDQLSSAPGSEAEDEEGGFLQSWRALQRACGVSDPEALREEFDTLFVSVGKAPVTPYTSSYAAPHAPDRHLLELRRRLQALGLARRERVFEVEDHVSALCDTMRWLIEQERPLEEQRAFFGDFIDPGVLLFCDAINRSPLAAFYRTAADFTRAFVLVEKDAFDMHLPA
jgi:TorA maturation chaperone TorD